MITFEKGFVNMKKLAPVHSVLYHSPSPEDVYTYSPGIMALPGGRLIATLDMGGSGVESLPVTEKGYVYGKAVTGMIFISDDGGDSWRHVANFPFEHARPFRAGKSIYVLGHAMDLKIIRSDDEGETWSEVYALTEGEEWHQAPCNVWYANDSVYLVMEKMPYRTVKCWAVPDIAPVLMRGALDADLTRRENWTFATEMIFKENINVKNTNYFGMPMYNVSDIEGSFIAEKRHCSTWGWLETNVVQIMPENHIWHDKTGHTFHLISRAHTGHTNYACIMKVVEQSDGSMITQFEHAPSGEKWVYQPLPGGQMKFHIVYDEVSKLYWLLSTQTTDSMICPDRMPKDRYSIPDNERRRLQLHFSTNCIDWCFAGLVDMGDTEKESRHYGSMCIRGNDLCILSRSGDKDAFSPHNTDMITFHVVKDFRDLIY